jgi:signal peptidase II
MGMTAGWLLPLMLAAVLLADQLLKGLVVHCMRGAQVVALGPGVRIRPARSHRTFAGRLGIPLPVLSVLWLAILVAVLLVAPKGGQFASPLSRAALGAGLGGAAGNGLDTFVRKGVVDYLEVGRWPAFNLADVAIVVGVIVALLAR